MAVLAKLNARYRGRRADAPLPLDPKALATTGPSLFMTDLGPLDCLGTIEGARTCDDLVPLSVEVDMDGRLLVLRLETIVELKKQSTEAKDRSQLPVLEETLRRRGR
jgi:hypothetical protein